MATFKKFKNNFKGNVKDDIWINLDHIISAFESLNVDTETNDMKPTVTLFSKDGLSFQIDEPISDVIMKLGNSEPIQDGMNEHFKSSNKIKKKIDTLKKL